MSEPELFAPLADPPPPPRNRTGLHVAAGCGCILVALVGFSCASLVASAFRKKHRRRTVVSTTSAPAPTLAAGPVRAVRTPTGTMVVAELTNMSPVTVTSVQAIVRVAPSKGATAEVLTCRPVALRLAPGDTVACFASTTQLAPTHLQLDRPLSTPARDAVELEAVVHSFVPSPDGLSGEVRGEVRNPSGALARMVEVGITFYGRDQTPAGACLADVEKPTIAAGGVSPFRCAARAWATEPSAGLASHRVSATGIMGGSAL